MKYIISSDVLLKNIQSISGVISQNTSIPILETFLFELKENNLLITASDLETSIQVNIPVSKVEKEGTIAIPAKIFTETIKTFPPIPITVSADNPDNPLNVEIFAGEGQYKVSGYEPNDYPKRPHLEKTDSIEINSKILATAITKTVFATTNDMLRPAMTGVNCEITDTHTCFVGTDAHRLVRYKRNNITSESPFSFILPKKTSTVLKNILQNFDTSVKVDFNKINASFSFENYNLICRLIDQKYPNYEAVIPIENPNKLIVNRLELINSLRRATIYANQATHFVRFIITGQTLTLRAEDIDFANEAVETIQCNYSGQDAEIGYSAKFILEMLQNLDTENVTLEFSEGRRASLLLPTEHDNPDEEILMLAMPIVLKEN